MAQYLRIGALVVFLIGVLTVILIAAVLVAGIEGFEVIKKDPISAAFFGFACIHAGLNIAVGAMPGIPWRDIQMQTKIRVGLLFDSATIFLFLLLGIPQNWLMWIPYSVFGFVLLSTLYFWLLRFLKFV